MLRRFLCVSALVVLSGCRLDVTQTIDFTTPGSEIITYSETFDDEAFAVTRQLGGSQAFGFDAAKQDGWDISGSSGSNRHTFIFQRSLSTADAELQLTRLAHDSIASTPRDAFLLGPTAFIGVPITASLATPKRVSIPALLWPSLTVAKDGRKDPGFQLANARVNAAAVDSVVYVHIEIRDAAGVHRIDPRFAESTEISPSAVTSLHVGSHWPLSPILAFWRAVGPYGVFDYEHYSRPLCKAEPKYHKSWMFGVGVYASGAGIPENLLDNAGTLAEHWLEEHPVRCP